MPPLPSNPNDMEIGTYFSDDPGILVLYLF